MRLLFSIIILALRLFTREDPSGEPSYIQYLLYPFLDERDRETFIGDLIQDYKKICSESNKIEADNWLHNELFTSLGSLIKRPAILINSLWKLNIQFVRSSRFAFATINPKIAFIITSILFISLLFWIAQLKSKQLSVIQNGSVSDNRDIEIPSSEAGELKAPDESRTAELIAPKTQPANRLQVKASKPQPSAPLAYTIVLTSPTVLRDMEQDNVKDSFIRVPNTPVRMKLLLGNGSTSGAYNVRILDAFGNPLRANKVQSNGKFVTATFDMSQIPPRKYFISVSREGEAPIFYPVVVVKK